MAIASVVLAALLSIVGVTSLNVDQVPGRDSLRLSSASRALTTSVDRLPRDGWSSQRGESLSGGEIQADIDALDDALYHVKIGVYSNSTYDLDLSIPSFSSNGYVWMRWKQPLQDYLEANDTDLQEHISLLNALLSDADPVLHPVQDKPAILSDGTYYQLYTYVGRFYIDRASFRHFPFLTISLPIAIEADDVAGGLGYGTLRFEPDSRNSGMGLYAGTGIIGWLNRGWSIAEYRHNYATNFGLGGLDRDYSLILYDITFGTSSWSSFWRLMLPLLVVMVMVLLVFKIRPDEQDARAGIPVTVLLTLVFLQQVYRGELPDLPFLTFLDQVYVIAYVITLLAFVLLVWIGRRYADMESMPLGEARDNLSKRLEFLDEVWPLSMVLFCSIAVVTSWYLIPAGA
ncbi:putative membrane protein [Synechococcus sp. ROS8604]|nr:putative membrane protein [Synechococcus sp. ROS8604]